MDLRLDPPAQSMTWKEPDRRCQYPSKLCLRERARKRDGVLHKLCEYHRVRANFNQRRLQQRRRCEKMLAETAAKMQDEVQRYFQDIELAQLSAPPMELSDEDLATKPTSSIMIMVSQMRPDQVVRSMTASPFVSIATTATSQPGASEMTLAPNEWLRCRYVSKRCECVRAVKKNGELHKFCEYHREKANRNQRRLDHRRRMERILSNLEVTPQQHFLNARIPFEDIAAASEMLSWEPLASPSQLRPEDIQMLQEVFMTDDVDIEEFHATAMTFGASQASKSH
ncbi:TPA: hypothetical protein N0F65_000927 [Lagenidium giganteum]|uniref:Uncharacterized protein n=1 Tax=Lagenidium giganteum TaxID=4803 RepID=A0AAV2YM60_9STRA|nr:TPA: hypothetical protein N0F65_000927 [Lagenidium giganteum]